MPVLFRDFFRTLSHCLPAGPDLVARRAVNRSGQHDEALPAEPAAARDPRGGGSAPGSGAVLDPDVDLRDPRQEQATRGGERAMLAAIALGGVLGAEARYLVGIVVPGAPAPFPLPTLLINMTGCLLLGVLMVTVTELRTVHRLVRPFLGTGVLGGYTTFSGFASDVLGLARAGHPAMALACLALTLAAGWAAAWTGMAVTRRLGRRRGGDR